MQKLMRNGTTRLGFWASVTIASSLAIVYLRMPALPSDIISYMMALLLAATLADVRGTARRYMPPEIICQRGTVRFYLRQLCTATLWAIGAVSPLIATLVHMSTADQQIIYLAVQHLFIGLGVGIFATTCIVPRPGSIGGQCLAAACCIGLVSGIPRLIWWQGLGQYSAMIAVAVISLALIICGAAIEYIRNPYIWRDHA